MKREIPDPRPWRFWSTSSNRSTIKYKQLNDDQEANAGFDLRRIALHSGHDVYNGLTDRYEHSEQLLGSVEQLPVFRRVTNFDDQCSDSSCIISPEVTIGKIPSSINVCFPFYCRYSSGLGRLIPVKTSTSFSGVDSSLP